MKFPIVLFSLLLTTQHLPAQPSGIIQSSDLLTIPTGDKFLRWFGNSGRSYFVQVSDSNTPLRKWSWAPIIEAGNNQIISYEVDGTTSKGFFRLKYTDQPIPSGKTLETADFDNDGISNIGEIAPQSPLTATDPLDSDSDDDGMSDGWERSFALSLLASGQPTGYWGSNYGDLLTGNLSFGTDYTNEGITAGELAVYAARPQGEQPEDGIYRKSQAKRNILSWGLHVPAVNGQPERNEGLYYSTNDGYFGTGYDITTRSQLTPAYLAQQVVLNPWADDMVGGMSRFLATNYSGSIRYSGTMWPGRTRFLRLKPDPTALTLPYLKVTERRYNPSVAYPTYAAEAIQIQIPAGKLLSDWVDLTPPIIENSEHWVNLQPVDITVVFGVGTDDDPSSRQLLESYLNVIKVARLGDLWAVNGKDAQGNDRIWGIEIGSDQAKLNEALTSGWRHVVFDGHSNYGFGPDFLGATNINRVSDFTNYGVKYTDVPLTFRKLLRNPENINDLSNFGDVYREIVIPDEEFAVEPTNYKPDRINEERFPNMDMIGENQKFPKQGEGFDTWHYRIEGGSKRLMIKAPKTDLPTNLSYTSFFYNACSSGIDYIENFKHGDFIYTKKECWVQKGTKIFVQGVVEGKATAQIIPLLNAKDVGSGTEGEIIYSFETF